tara:strand:- start:2675 stop:3160 length:486 start_codon:yes stop_codon:yes gene_type:complete
MIDLIKVVDGSPVAYSFDQLKRDNPTTSFPASPHNVDLGFYGVAAVRNVQPSHDPATQSNSKGVTALVDGVWVNEWLVADKPIGSIREGMTCTPLQGKLAIGETLWAGVVTYSETAPWVQRMVIESASNWHRTSQDIQFIGYLLGVTDIEMDDLFRLAVTL